MYPPIILGATDARRTSEWRRHANGAGALEESPQGTPPVNSLHADNQSRSRRFSAADPI
jgi:hypothetical protein